MKIFTSIGSIILSVAIALIAGLYIYMEFFLPDVSNLKQAEMQIPLRIYTNDGKLIGEFGEERRSPVTLSKVPKLVIDAVLATEDQRFFHHQGVDPYGLVRAAVELITTGKKKQGGSTITMQVARNFYLTRKKTYIRKFNEILLAIKIDHELSKNKILELYLNKIFFGNRAYGIAAAAKIYYGKKLDQLTLPEVAMLAGLPQAPSKDNPIANPIVAKERRNHVLERMLEGQYITQAQYDKAVNTPVKSYFHGLKVQVRAPYVAEMVRSELLEHFGKEVYGRGFTVYTTINSRLQKAANNALRTALMGYDQRHGYRRPTKNFGKPDPAKFRAWQKQLAAMPILSGLAPAIVISKSRRTADVLLGNGGIVHVPWVGLAWPRRGGTAGLFRLGDLIHVEELPDGLWRLGQVPKVEGAIVALDPFNGAILALDGGFDYLQSNFNRAVQGKRQVGSAFKPFLYTAALAKGYTMASIVNDAPVTIFDKGSGKYWRPENASRSFAGPTRLRVGLYRSRNTVSVRLTQQIGLAYARNFITRFGFHKPQLPKGLSISLGTAELSPLEMAAGYAVFANGGHKITPFVIRDIYDARGKLVFQAKPPTVYQSGMEKDFNLPRAPQVVSPQIAYIMTSAMQDVIKRGTGRRALVLKRNDIAGKTGTTNDQYDAWFSGYNHEIVATAWVGFDTPKSLREYGGRAALPMWIDFMRVALEGKPEETMPEPPGIVSARINPGSGRLTRRGGIFEIFREDHLPTAYNYRTHYGYSYDHDESEYSTTGHWQQGSANHHNNRRQHSGEYLEQLY